jgi:hypothetical protein
MLKQRLFKHRTGSNKARQICAPDFHCQFLWERIWRYGVLTTSREAVLSTVRASDCTAPESSST